MTWSEDNVLKILSSAENVTKKDDKENVVDADFEDVKDDKDVKDVKDDKDDKDDKEKSA